MKNETEKTVKTPIFTTSVAIISLIVLFSAACALLLFTKYSHQNFAEYSKKTAETLAYQASSVIKDTNDVKTPILQSLAKATLHNDKNVMYIEKHQIQNLKKFCENFGAIPIICIKFNYIKYTFIKISNLTKTDKGNFKITKKALLNIIKNNHELML